MRVTYLGENPKEFGGLVYCTVMTKDIVEER